MDIDTLQQYLPEELVTKAIPVDPKSTGHFAWQYNDAVELVHWLWEHRYLVDFVQVIPRGKNPLSRSAQGWFPETKKSLNRDKKLADNIRKTLNYLQKTDSNSTEELLYEIFFYHEIYVLQQDLPEDFIKNAIDLKRETFIYYGWYYPQAIELLDWIKDNSLVILNVQVLINHHGQLGFYNHRWRYRGERDLKKAENLKINFQSVLRFVNDVHAGSEQNLIYEIHYDSEQRMTTIDRDYYHRAIYAGGFNYRIDDALEIIERCQREQRTVVGIEVFYIDEVNIQPVDIRSYDSEGNWDEASCFIRESNEAQTFFQMAYR